jgi:hypothetical protein
MRPLRPLAVILLLGVALAAAPASAYTIYLKDGSRIVAKEKYVVRGNLALITLPSGTQSSIAASEIDAARTEQANKSNIGTAVAIEGGKAVDLQQKAPPPPRPRLQDYIKSNAGGLRAPDKAAPPAATAANTPAAALRRSERAAPSRAPLPDTALAGEIRGFATARGVSSIDVHQGSSPKRPLLVFGTSSEGALFKALVVASNTLLHLESTKPGAIEGFDVLCETPDGGLGGRFELTPKLASDLVSGRYEITRFFVENVRF